MREQRCWWDSGARWRQQKQRREKQESHSAAAPPVTSMGSFAASTLFLFRFRWSHFPSKPRLRVETTSGYRGFAPEVLPMQVHFQMDTEEDSCSCHGTAINPTDPPTLAERWDGH